MGKPAGVDIIAREVRHELKIVAQGPAPRIQVVFLQSQRGKEPHDARRRHDQRQV